MDLSTTRRITQSKSTRPASLFDNRLSSDVRMHFDYPETSALWSTNFQRYSTSSMREHSDLPATAVGICDAPVRHRRHSMTKGSIGGYVAVFSEHLASRALTDYDQQHYNRERSNCLRRARRTFDRQGVIAQPLMLLLSSRTEDSYRGPCHSNVMWPSREGQSKGRRESIKRVVVTELGFGWTLVSGTTWLRNRSSSSNAFG